MPYLYIRDYKIVISVFPHERPTQHTNGDLSFPELFTLTMYSKQLSANQFRAFTPAAKPNGHIGSLDRVAREHSQRQTQSTFSFSQSQEQTTASQHAGSSGQESQVSLTRYDDLLASGRHLEIKDAIAAVNRTVTSLSQGLGAIETTLSAQGTKLAAIQSSLHQLQDAQVRQEQSCAQLCRMVEQMRNERKSTTYSTERNISAMKDEVDAVSSLSEEGISVSEYLSVKRLQIRGSPAQGDGRKRARSDSSSQVTTDSIQSKSAAGQTWLTSHPACAQSAPATAHPRSGSPSCGVGSCQEDSTSALFGDF